MMNINNSYALNCDNTDHVLSVNAINYSINNTNNNIYYNLPYKEKRLHIFVIRDRLITLNKSINTSTIILKRLQTLNMLNLLKTKRTFIQI